MKKTPRILKPIRMGNYTGYQLSNDEGVLVSKYRHRLTLEVFVGAAPAGLECAHLDGDKSNNDLSNLAWVSHEENESHKRTHGTLPSRERNGMAKLGQCQVNQMRLMRETTGRSFSSIAKDFGVSTMTAFRAITERAWK